MDQAAFGELQPLSVVSHIDLPTADGVGMLDLRHPPLGSRKDGLDEQRDHLEQIGRVCGGGAAESPQVDLVRLADVRPVDDVAAVGQARHDDQLVHFVGSSYLSVG